MKMILMSLSAILFLSPQVPADEPVRAKVEIPIPQAELQKLAIEYNLDIERGGPGFVYGYLNEHERSLILSAGIDFRVLYHDYRDEGGWVLSLFDFGEYHSHDEVMFFLDSVATANPEICALDTLGESIENRAIVGIRISANPGIEEDEPEVRIMGAHHGDEKISVELPLYMIDYLTVNYGTDILVTRLVNNTEIFIVPMVNPDGVTDHSRYNSRYQDLNRDYLCPEGDYCPSGANNQNAFSESETQAVRQDALANRYVLSLSLHAGATNINTVWNYDDGLHHNGDYHPTPDDDLVMDLSQGYADRNTTSGFYVTNGCDWYSTHGDANDYSYGWLSDIDWTIEISQQKTPPETYIEDYWNENRLSMLYIIDMADIGIRGVATDSLTGEPLDAIIRITEGGVPIYTDPLLGDYHRLLLPGTYNIRVESPGYISTEMGPIEVAEGSAQRYDFQLVPAEMTTLEIAVEDSIDGSPLEANISIRSSVYDTLFNYDGYPVSISLNSDIYDITVFSEGYQPELDHALLVGDVAKTCLLSPYSVDLFADDFEGDPDGWLFGGGNNYWGIGDDGFNSGHSLEDSPGNYSSYSFNYARINQIFDLTAFESAGLYFVEKHYFEPYYDFLFVEISSDGGNSWDILPDTLTGFTGTEWYDHFISLDDYCGPGFDNMAIRFLLDTDPNNTYDGAYIDEFYFGGMSSASAVDEPIQKPKRIELGQNYPNPFNSTTAITFAGIDPDNPPDLEIYDLLGRLVNSLKPENVIGNAYIWRGLDDQGNPVSSGIYFYKLSDGIQIRSMTLLK
ncbi:MAG: M14 family zinc carboxypeptidase [candidate division Zixibacteria bacterium]